MNVKDEDKSGNFIIQCIQLVPKQACKTHEFHKMFLVKPNSDCYHPFKIKVGFMRAALKVHVTYGHVAAIQLFTYIDSLVLMT